MPTQTRVISGWYSYTNIFYSLRSLGTQETTSALFKCQDKIIRIPAVALKIRAKIFYIVRHYIIMHPIFFSVKSFSILSILKLRQRDYHLDMDLN